MVSPGGVVSGASVVADVSVPSVGIELSCVGFVGVSGSFFTSQHRNGERQHHGNSADCKAYDFFGSFHS